MRNLFHLPNIQIQEEHQFSHSQGTGKMLKLMDIQGGPSNQYLRKEAVQEIQSGNEVLLASTSSFYEMAMLEVNIFT